LRAVWEAVFGPKGDDGYPARVWCKDPSPSAQCEYGAINRTVVQYWRDHFDLTERLRRHWSSGLGAKLNGKLHVYVGAADSFFLTNAVMDLQDWANDPQLDPPFQGTIVIGAHEGRGYEHCFNGYLPDGTPAVCACRIRTAHAPHQHNPDAPPSTDAKRLPCPSRQPNAITRELYVTKFLPRMAERWAATAPAGANMEWHEY
jgi:hypothetical protein